MGVRRFLLAWGLVVCLSGTARAADLGQPDVRLPSRILDRELRVGVVVAPPFISKNQSGQFDGITLDIWRDVAHDLGLRWKTVEYDLPGLLAAVRAGEVDVGVTDLSITPDREAVMDFSLPYYTTGFGIMVTAKNSGGLLSGLLSRLASRHILGYLGMLIVLLLLAGVVMWLVERRQNDTNFRPGRQGIGDGLWWSAVTMTAVGYGDKTPRTALGRFLALIWMFLSVILIAVFTAGLTSSLTLEGMGGSVNGPGDLYKVRTGVKSDSTAEASLEAAHVGVYRYAKVEEGIAALLSGEIDAFVHDRPVLLYLQHNTYMGRVRVLPVTFDPQQYGFAFPSQSVLRKAVNVAMLRRLDDRDYRRRLFGVYLGRDETQ